MFKRLSWIFVVLALVMPFAVMAQVATPVTTPVATPEPVMEEELIALPEIDPLAVSGDIIIAGSSTVFPLTEAVAEIFLNDGFAGAITVDSIGTGAGFERFCVAGETDIANASRPIRQSERDSCAQLNPPRNPIEIRIGTDALAIAVSRENTFVESLTIEQLARIFSGEFARWSDVDPSFPNEPIQLFSPGTDSGTFDYFVEEVISPGLGDLDEAESEAAILNAAGIQFSEDDNVLVRGIEASQFAIGYFGFAFYVENTEGLRALAIDAGEGAVEPDADSVNEGTYELARPLFIYTDAGIITNKPQVGAFVVYYLENVNEVVERVGYFPAPIAQQNEARQTIIDVLAGGQ